MQQGRTKTQQKQQQPASQAKPKQNSICFKCNQRGHIAKYYLEKEKNGKSLSPVINHIALGNEITVAFMEKLVAIQMDSEADKNVMREDVYQRIAVNHKLEK